ncbi:hypothetical protein [Glycomyces artemisiae]|uniref:Uncharacterized protein n=1 Tax=Glycomyces artemisiae TaxID=1076443 RepID=A0A2T0UWL8_9ACTN|nr:hypothetical protein [Glycomyces artemisiae]PRY62325.1 hypothetical protein B0I28_101653 [Glycomyces artemisiae]
MPGSEVEQVTDRPHWRDAVRTAAGAALASGAVAAAAGSTSNSWPLALIAAAGFLAWPLTRLRNLAKRQPVAEFDRQGVRLYPQTSQRNRSLSPIVELPWSEVKGIHLWRKRTGLYWTTMVGVETVRADHAPGDTDRRGVPPHVTSALARRSVPFSASGRGRLQAAASRFFRARITDARSAPATGRRRKVY